MTITLVREGLCDPNQICGAIQLQATTLPYTFTTEVFFTEPLHIHIHVKDCVEKAYSRDVDISCKQEALMMGKNQGVKLCTFGLDFFERLYIILFIILVNGPNQQKYILYLLYVGSRSKKFRVCVEDLYVNACLSGD